MYVFNATSPKQQVNAEMWHATSIPPNDNTPTYIALITNRLNNSSKTLKHSTPLFYNRIAIAETDYMEILLTPDTFAKLEFCQPHVLAFPTNKTPPAPPHSPQ